MSNIFDIYTCLGKEWKDDQIRPIYELNYAFLIYFKGWTRLSYLWYFLLYFTNVSSKENAFLYFLFHFQHYIRNIIFCCYEFPQKYTNNNDLFSAHYKMHKTTATNCSLFFSAGECEYPSSSSYIFCLFVSTIRNSIIFC